MTGAVSARFEQRQRLLDTGGQPSALTDDRGQLHQCLRSSPGVLAVVQGSPYQTAGCLDAVANWPSHPGGEDGVTQTARVLCRRGGTQRGRLVDGDQLGAVTQLPAERGQVKGEQLLFAAKVQDVLRARASDSRSARVQHRLADRREDFEQLPELLCGESSLDWTCLPGYQAESAVRLAGDRGSGCKSMDATGIEACDRRKVDY
jgi:hypothetical protein